MTRTDSPDAIDYDANDPNPGPSTFDLTLETATRFARLFVGALIAAFLAVDGPITAKTLLGVIAAAFGTAWREFSNRRLQGSAVRSLVTKARTGLRSPEALGWGNPGAPGSSTGRQFAAAHIVTRTAKRSGIRITAHRDAIALFLGFIDELEARGYDVRQKDTGAWNHRFMRALGRTLSKLSAHSWGIALDLNWSTNPQSRKLRTDLPQWAIDLGTVKYGFVWGGRFSLRDAMHWQLNETPAQARARAARLGLTA
jgi:hypothetical protein